MPQRVLVTGGAGFVGSHAAEYYANRGVDVTILDNLSRQKTLSTADESRATGMFNWQYLAEKYPSIKRIEGDIRDRSLVEEIVEDQDGIIHAAGQVAVTSSLRDPRTDFEVNAQGTFNILEAARKASSDPVVVFASTNKVYGDNVNSIDIRDEGQRYWFDETEYESGVPESLSIDQSEHTPYGVSKLAGDLYVQDYAERGVVDAAVFRMSCIYGTRQFGNEDQGWVAHFILSTIRDEELTIFGDGKQVRDILWVEDLIRAYDSFLSDPVGKSTVYNIGGGPDNTISLLELLDVLESNTGQQPSVTFDEWREGDQKVYVSDISKAERELDWKPNVDPETGIKKYLEWYEKEFSN